MRVLAIDTALGACSVAVVETEGGEARVFSVPMERGHAEALMPLVAQALDEAGGVKNIEAIAVTVGPGSFTGLRVGLACARALALGAKIPVVGVSTLTALAAPVLDSGDGVSPVAAAIDARHGRVFFQAFSGDGRPLVAPRVTDARDAARALGDGPTLVVGSGAGLVIAAAENGAAALADAPHAAPDPIWVARLGAAGDPETSPPKPLYLKAADAHPSTSGLIARI
jgi:tRNA threonylcarbamoyladenosine biosynthesis protein TsaB